MSDIRLIHDKTRCHGLELQSGIAMLPQQPCHQSVSTAHVHPSPGRGFPLTPAPDESICRRSIKIGQNRTPVVKKEAFYRSAHWGGCQCRSPAHAGDTPGLYGVRPVSALLFRGLCRAGTLVACMSDPVCRHFRPFAVARIWKIEFKMVPPKSIGRINFTMAQICAFFNPNGFGIGTGVCCYSGSGERKEVEQML